MPTCEVEIVTAHERFKCRFKVECFESLQLAYHFSEIALSFYTDLWKVILDQLWAVSYELWAVRSYLFCAKKDECCEAHTQEADCLISGTK